MGSNYKLWVFQSNRILTSSEEKHISEILSKFIKSWTAHGDELKSSFKITDHKFIIIQIDENITKASGCSIDSLNQCIRKIDVIYNLDLLNRLLVSYENTPGVIETVPMNLFKEKIKNSQLSQNSIIYNLSVSTLKEFNEKFKLPLKKSWANVFINQ